MKSKTFHNKQRGNVTLVGTILAIGLATTFAMFQVTNKVSDAELQLALLAGEETLAIRDAIQQHLTRTGGSWPGEGSSPRCNDAIQVLSNFAPSPLLAGIETTNLSRNPYVIRCVGPGNVISNTVSITQTFHPAIARIFVNKVPSSEFVDEDNGIVITHVLAPGLEPSVVGKLDADGDMELSGNWGVGNHEITEVTRIGVDLIETTTGLRSASNVNYVVNPAGQTDLASVKVDRLESGRLTLTDIVVPGTACPNNGEVAVTARGTPMSCSQGQWDPLLSRTKLETTRENFGRSWWHQVRIVRRANRCWAEDTVHQVVAIPGEGGETTPVAYVSASPTSDVPDSLGNVDWQIYYLADFIDTTLVIACEAYIARIL